MACIVSIFDSNDKLIGFYGDINASCENLYDEIVENAIGAASKNKDCEPIKSEQLNNIKVYVDVLSSPHLVEDLNELKPHKHGLIIKDKNGLEGFIMPNIKGIKTVDKQIEKIKRDYNIAESDHSKLEIKYFKSTRYD
jgi:AMMECR1 domain-containing protein